MVPEPDIYPLQRDNAVEKEKREHDDVFMDRVAAEAEALRPGTIVAREGMVLRP